MAWAVEGGLITGRTETTLAPAGAATRAEAALCFFHFPSSISLKFCFFGV
jgi:hypothetical protein